MKACDIKKNTIKANRADLEMYNECGERRLNYAARSKDFTPSGEMCRVYGLRRTNKRRGGGLESSVEKRKNHNSQKDAAD